MWNLIRPGPRNLRLWQLALLIGVFVFWHVMTQPGWVPRSLFAKDNDASFFFGEPLKIFARIWDWFVIKRDIYTHLWVTLIETILAFAIGTIGGLGAGLWLALNPSCGGDLRSVHQGLSIRCRGSSWRRFSRCGLASVSLRRWRWASRWCSSSFSSTSTRASRK